MPVIPPIKSISDIFSSQGPLSYSERQRFSRRKNYSLAEFMIFGIMAAAAYSVNMLFPSLSARLRILIVALLVCAGFFIFLLLRRKAESQEAL